MPIPCCCSGWIVFINSSSSSAAILGPQDVLAGIRFWYPQRHCSTIRVYLFKGTVEKGERDSYIYIYIYIFRLFNMCGMKMLLLKILCGREVQCVPYEVCLMDWKDFCSDILCCIKRGGQIVATATPLLLMKVYIWQVTAEKGWVCTCKGF